MDLLQREKVFNFWMNIRLKYNSFSHNICVKHVEILLVSIFDVLPLVSKKKIFDSTPPQIFLCVFGLQKVPYSNRISDLQEIAVTNLSTFFDESYKKKNQNDIHKFAQDLKSVSNTNLHSSDLNNYILKLLNFIVGRCDLNLFLRLRESLKFLMHQNLQFNVDLIENMFEKLKENNDGRIDFFYLFIQSLAHSESYKSCANNFIRTLSSNRNSQIFFVKTTDNADLVGLNFKKRKLDFTSTPMVKDKLCDETLFEHSLEKMCLKINELKNNVNRQLTTNEQNLTLKLIKALQSML